MYNINGNLSESVESSEHAVTSRFSLGEEINTETEKENPTVGKHMEMAWNNRALILKTIALFCLSNKATKSEVLHCAKFTSVIGTLSSKRRRRFRKSSKIRW